MLKDDFSGFRSAFEEMNKLRQPYQDAMEVLQRNGHFADMFENPLADRLGIMNSALTQGLVDDSLSNSISEMFAPYHELSAIQSALDALGTSFSPLINTDIFSSMHLFEDKMDWMKQESNWMVNKSLLADLDTLAISGMTGAFATLCRLEQETALIPTIPDSLISASSQIASVASVVKQNSVIDDFFSSTRILEDYCDLAIKQYRLINSVSDQEEVSWRLGMMDAVSKYVDRQVSWTVHIADDVAKSGIDVDVEALEEPDDYESGIALIPTHIGYTKRADVDKTPSEGLEESVIVAITEKGKQISEGVLTINKLKLDDGADRVFGLSETVVKGLMDVGSIICINDDQLGKVIDGLYFIFYENIEHIKLLAGNGDKEKGDALVRNEEIYQCIFDVKTIRSDLRHDLDHGKDNERRKKLKSVGDCYKSYCGRRPLKEKDFKKLQNKLYDEILILENRLIEMLVNGVC